MSAESILMKQMIIALTVNYCRSLASLLLNECRPLGVLEEALGMWALRTSGSLY